MCEHGINSSSANSVMTETVIEWQIINSIHKQYYFQDLCALQKR